MEVTILLVTVALVMPHFVKARWSSSGVPVTFKIAVAGAETGEPIPGAKVLVYVVADANWRINEGSVGHISATTDANGTCEVTSYFPGSGSGDKARLKVNSTIWIRADGYEPWQHPTAALLGSYLNVSGAFQTNSFLLKMEMKRQ